MEILVDRNMPAVEYHSIAGASASRLKALRRSPMHLRHMDEEPIKGAALEFGEAFHTAILEPMRFANDYAFMPDGIDRRTKEGKATYQTMLDTFVGKKVMSYDDGLALTGMASAVQANSTAMELLQGRTETEISLVWSELDIKCKARIDAYNLEQRCIIDLKTTQDASPSEFARSVAAFGYHIQAAWYMRAMRRAKFDVETMVFIAVEKTAPYGVACYTLDSEAIAEGEREVARLLPILSNCIHTNNWHGYDEMIQTLRLPRWAIRGEEASL